MGLTKVSVIKKKSIDVDNQTQSSAVFEIGFW
jgi:hypothetical protein